MKKYLFLLVAILASAKLFAQAASGGTTLAIGTNTTATGQNTFATGASTQAGGQTSSAIGYNCKATATYSIAMGTLANAGGEQAIAIGNSVTSSGGSSMALGLFTTASGQGSTAMGGYMNTNGKRGAFAIGDWASNNIQMNNDGDNQMLMRFAGGYKFFLSNSTQPFSINPNGTINIDPGNINNGTINSGLIFGLGSGEGIASKRTGGGNQYGLDFYSNFINRMSITNAGKVGIGTTAPQQMLSLAGSMNIDQNNANTGALNPGLSFGSGSGEGISSNRNGDMNRNSYGLDFYTGGMNRMVIKNSGDVGIGITSPGQKLHVVGNILASGSITPSDIRYKKNIIPVENALKKIMSVSGYYYSFKVNEFPEMGFDTKNQIGVIAQDIEKVLPEVVVTLQNGYKTVDYPKLIPLLIEGIKEQQHQIEELKKLVFELMKK